MGVLNGDYVLHCRLKHSTEWRDQCWHTCLKEALGCMKSNHGDVSSYEYAVYHKGKLVWRFGVHSIQ